MSTMSATHFAPAAPLSAAPASAGPSMLVNAPVAPSWTPWMMRLERLAFKACLSARRAERRSRRVTVTLHLVDGGVARRSAELPRSTDQAADVIPAALGLLRLLLAEHEGRVARLGVSLGQLVEGAGQPIRFERYLARRRQAKFMKLASLLTCFGALGSMFTLR